MPITDLFDRAEGYGHDQGVQATKDDGNWTTQPTLPDAEDRLESTSDRLYRSVDTKHAWEGPEDYDGDAFVGDYPLTPYRRSVSVEWEKDDDDNFTGALVLDENGVRPELTYQGENERLDIESTEAAVYNRPALAYDGGGEVNSDIAYGTVYDPEAKHLGYRDEDGNFDAEVADATDPSEDIAKPNRSTLYDVAESAPQPPPEDELESEADLVELYDPNLDPQV